MIYLNLPIRRLVTGAILLAAMATPSFGRGPGSTTQEGCWDANGNRIVRTTMPDGTSGIVWGINYANMGCFVVQ